MKFEDFLMRRDEEHQKRLVLKQEVRDKEHQKRLVLEQEVSELQEVLEKEQKMKQILQCAFHGPIIFCTCLFSFLPAKVHELLVELAIIEDEIIYLEKVLKGLKVCSWEERRQEKQLSLHLKQHHQNQQRLFLCGLGNEKNIKKFEQSPMLPNTEYRSMSCADVYDQQSDTSIRIQYKSLHDEEIGTAPNKLSEELMKVLIGIFHVLNQTSTKVKYEPTPSPEVTTSCMSSRNFMFKSSFSCKTSVCSSKNATKMIDPYGIISDIDGKERDIGSYKNFIHFTSSSLDMSRISLCLPIIGRLRTLMHKLSTVELSSSTYKQKLAFWINIYNASIMHAFLQHGLPPSSDKLLTLLNKAALNVGGVVLNALAIEHFILRHSSQAQKESVNEKGALLRHAYGLDYPEPNVTFALCRGSWSSPALRVYTAENVVNELEMSKVEYLEASIGITNKKIFLPKLLHWHMREFADDVESLLEWVYSQLPRSSSLKRSIMECLSRDTKIPPSKLVEMQRYEEEFRYLLPPILQNLTNER